MKLIKIMKSIFLSLLLILSSLTINAQSFLSDTINLSEVTVTSPIVAAKQTPFTFQNLNRKEISLRSMNSEPGLLLSYTPSITQYSDNGFNIGYSYYRLRGIDQTKINSTFNGVPLNEPEDQGIYYNNFPDFLNSVSSIQIIRGVGLSKPGISSYGGSLNFMPQNFSDKFSIKAKIAYGSYNTMLLSGGVNTPRFFVNFSVLKTDGFKYDVFNKSWSTFYGTNIDVKNHNFKLYGYVGHQKNGMGWIGEPIDSIYKDRRFNSNTKNETDEFTHVHNQLNWTYKNLSTTFYHTHINGGYGIDNVHYGFDGIDTVNVKSNLLGLNFNYLIPIKNFFFINSGINTYTYKREHYGDETAWYYNFGTKNSISPYVKGELKIKGVTFYGDAQYRYSILKYKGDSLFPSKYYNFLTWSAGTNIKINENLSIYYGIGKTYKEPKRYDYFGGLENFSPMYYTPLVPEELLSNELGVKYLSENLYANVNVYYMKFKNEMALTGNLGYNAMSLSNVNIDNSFRTGIEFDVKYKLNKFEFSTSSAFSYNKLEHLNQERTPVLTPNVIMNYDIMYNIKKWIFFGSTAKYVGKTFIDFKNEHTLPRYTTLNLYSGINLEGFEIRANINNVTNNLILGSAYMNWDASPRYFAMAGINGMISLSYKF